MLGDISKESFGPGSKYQIDATKLNVCCVSEKDRNLPIGTIYFYAVMDIFSRLIVGMYVGAGPGWIGGMMALHNVVENKVEYCKKYGIKISEEEWPSTMLSEKILADNGEFGGEKPNSLIDNLHISIENTKPYHGDCKGMIERYFGEEKKELTIVPGSKREKFRERGDKDERLDAVLTINELTRVMIRLVKMHNNSVLEHYDKCVFHIGDSALQPIPTKIWEWGITHRGSGCVFRDSRLVDLAVMPRGEATVTREGICFKGYYYTCQEALENEWFIKPGKMKLSVFFDPRKIDHIYIPKDDFQDYIVCNILAKNEYYGDLHYDDFKAIQEHERVMVEYLKHMKHEQWINTYTRNQEDIKAAAKAKRLGTSPLSKAQRLKGIRTRRAQEFDALKANEAFDLSKNTETKADSKIVYLVRPAAEGAPNQEFNDSILDIIKDAGERETDGEE